MDVNNKRNSRGGERTSTRKNADVEANGVGVINDGYTEYQDDPDLEDARSVISDVRSSKSLKTNSRQSSVYAQQPKDNRQTSKPQIAFSDHSPQQPITNDKEDSKMNDLQPQTKSILKPSVKPSYKLKNDIKSVLLMSSKQEIQDVNTRFNRTRRYDTAGKYRIGPTFITKARLSYLDANKPAKLSVIPDPSFKSLEFGLLTYLWTFTDQHDKTEIDLAFLQSLINSGVDINAADEYGQTALHAIVRDWHPDVVSFIIRNNADVNKADKWGRTPLHLAAAINSVEIAKILCLSGGKFFSLFKFFLKKTAQRAYTGSKPKNIL